MLTLVPPLLKYEEPPEPQLSLLQSQVPNLAPRRMMVNQDPFLTGGMTLVVVVEGGTISPIPVGSRYIQPHHGAATESADLLDETVVPTSLAAP